MYPFWYAPIASIILVATGALVVWLWKKVRR